MGDRFTKSHAVFARTDFPLEQRQEAFAAALGLFEMVHQPAQRAHMIVDQLPQAGWKPDEGKFMAAEDEMILNCEN